MSGNGRPEPLRKTSDSKLTSKTAVRMHLPDLSPGPYKNQQLSFKTNKQTNKQTHPLRNYHVSVVMYVILFLSKLRY